MDTVYCTSCGSANKPEARFCFKCGTPIQATDVPAPVQPKSDFITLSCPNCGGKLDITPDMERFACKYCGNEHLVRRAEGAISLAPVVESLKQVAAKFDQALTGSDRAAAEQTIQRLKSEIPELEDEVIDAQDYLKSISPRPSMHRLGKRLVVGGVVAFFAIEFLVGMFFIATRNVGFHDPKFDLIDTITTLLGQSGFFLAPLCIIIGWILVGSSRVKKVTRFNQKRVAAYQEKLEQAQNDLAQAQTELQKRKEQLAQLHQYTAER